MVDISSGSRVIGEVAFPAALTTLHEKAIYLHEGQLFHVDRFDFKERKAYVRRVECGYYTDAIEHTQVERLEGFDDDSLGASLANHGEVRITSRVVGFKKIRFHTNENVGDGKLSMPEQEMHTTAFWLLFPAASLASLPYSTVETRDGLIGLGNVLRTVAAVLLMCDPRDLGVSTSSTKGESESLLSPEIFLYDNFPGGIGQSEPLFRLRASLVSMARVLIEACPCTRGCPRCVGAPGDVGEKAKEVALRLLASLITEHQKQEAA